MVSGVVGRIGDRKFNGKTFYSFALNGQDGWYGTGVKRPPDVGTSVKFNEKTNSKGYLEVDGSIEILTDGQPQRADLSTVIKAASAGAGGGAAYWDRKEARDVANDSARELGASRNTAISIIDLAIKYEVITLPAKAKREEFLWTLLDRYTNKLMGKEGGDIVQEDDKGSSSESASNQSGDVASDEDNWN
jgi:hypothetical protein